ncbi:MAG: DUF177 domain-containing protein [Bacteroidales bacterium]|nr:DUF177 domain-containing protein [Candidatus Latescibacterota bacterium]
MQLDLAHVEERESFSFDERFEIPSAEGGKMECRVLVTADVTRTGSRYLLRAAIEGVIRTDCSKCLELFDYRIETGFDLVFQGGASVQIPEDLEEDDFIVLTGENEYCYDIFPRLREAVVLDLPIRYLCSEDCSGICPGCGENLNNADCKCNVTEGDSRWSSLKKLLKEQDE